MLCHAVLVHEVVSPPVFACQGGTQDMHSAPREQLGGTDPAPDRLPRANGYKRQFTYSQDVRLNIKSSEGLL